MPHVTAAGHRLEYVFLEPSERRAEAPGGAPPTLVFLHEGLGSVSMWKDFPQRVADATGCRALVYSRRGYGKSDRLAVPNQVDYMHKEAVETLPALLHALGIDNPILIGHSDGASIAIIHAGSRQWPVRALVLMAPHVLVEDISVESIAQAKVAYQTTDLPAKLGRYHDDPDHAFWGWNDIWLHPAFRYWNIEEYLPGIACPILAIQGEDDEYGTMDQIARIVRQAKSVEVLKLKDCRHSPHKDQPQAVVRAIEEFVGKV